MTKVTAVKMVTNRQVDVVMFVVACHNIPSHNNLLLYLYIQDFS